MLFAKKFDGSLDHIKLVTTHRTKIDHILRMVISTMQTTSWRATYGLSITETLKLEFADYFLMASELSKHDAIIKEGTDELTQDVLNNHRG